MRVNFTEQIVFSRSYYSELEEVSHTLYRALVQTLTFLTFL